MTTATARCENRKLPLGSTLSNLQLALLSDTLQRELSKASLTLWEPEEKKEFPIANTLSIWVSSPTSWILEAVDSLNSLLALEENWDSYCARKASPEAAFAAITLLHHVMDEQTPAPSIIPTPSGNIQLEWHRSEIDLEVEVTSSKTYFISYEDISGLTDPYEDDSPVHSVENPHPLFEYVSRITQRTNQEALST